MRLLKHPVRAIREPFGKAGLVVAVIALVLATTGAAFAAKGALTSGQKKEVEKIAKKYAGKPGATGPAGANGSNGAKGDAGAAGADGANGTNGTNGAPGANGKSVSVSSIAAGGSKCEGRAGAEVKQEGAGSGTAVCEGSPWTAGGTLPPGKTETGTWNISTSTSYEIFFPAVSVSFPIPLAESGPGHAYFFNAHKTTEEEFGSSGCSGSVANPTAPPGVLCMYTAFESSLGTTLFGSVNPHIPGDGATSGYGTTGASLSTYMMEGSAANPAYLEVEGTWAVTAPTGS
jgi:collagen triple helix repeat protein